MPVDSATIQRVDLKIAVILTVVTLVAGACWIDTRMLGNYADDGTYVTTAKALAEGRGYRIISLPNEPLQTKYPILYPLALAIVWKLWPSFPANIVALKSVGLVCASAAVGLAYLYLIRFGYFTRKTAAWAGAITATTPFYLSYAPQALSCPCFALLVVVGLWRLERLAEQRNAGWRTCLLTGMVIGLPFLTRSIGIVFGLPALAGKFGRRNTLWVALGGALVTLPWVAWTMWVLSRASSDPMMKYQTDYLGVSGNLNGGPNFSFWWSPTTRPYVPMMLIENTMVALGSAATLPLGGMTRLVSVWYPALIALVFSLGVLAWWAIIRLEKQRPILKWFLLAYVFTLCVWPWRSTRFFMPILPLLAPFLISGASGALGKILVRRNVEIAGRVALTLAVVLNSSTLIRGNIGSLFDSEGEQQVKSLWPSVSSALGWIRANAAPQDTVAAWPDAMVYLYTERKAVQPFVYQPAALFYGAHTGAAGTFADFEGYLGAHRPRFLLYQPNLNGAEDFAALIHTAEARYPGWIRRAYDAPDPRVVVYEFDWNRGP
jgi:hypothetical protein